MLKNAGVVLVVRENVEILQPFISVLAIQQRLKLAVVLDAAVLAHAQRK